jgi:hypothetical protein
LARRSRRRRRRRRCCRRRRRAASRGRHRASRVAAAALPAHAPEKAEPQAPGVGGAARFAPLGWERAKMPRMTARVWLCTAAEVRMAGGGRRRETEPTTAQTQITVAGRSRCADAADRAFTDPRSSASSRARQRRGTAVAALHGPVTVKGDGVDSRCPTCGVYRCKRVKAQDVDSRPVFRVDHIDDYIEFYMRKRQAEPGVAIRCETRAHCTQLEAGELHWQLPVSLKCSSFRSAL